MSSGQKWLCESSCWLIESVDGNYLSIGTSYVQLPKEVKHSRKSLISVQNKDNECCRWCHIRPLNPINKKTEEIKKSDKKMSANLDYKGI